MSRIHSFGPSFVCALLLSACSGGTPQSVDFVLENLSANSIFVQSTDAQCRSQTWVDVGDEAGHPFVDLGGPCTQLCGEAPRLCAALQDAIACLAPTVAPLAPASTLTRRWTGAYGIQKENCIENHEAEPDQDYTARFCWSTTRTGTAAPTGAGETLVNPTCETKTFRPGRDLEVRHVVR